jgi:long-chain acyl-CoA synthetase
MMLHDLFRASASLHADKTAIVAHGGRLTFRQLEAEAARLARELERLGASRGDRVGVLLANSAEAAVTLWAVLEAGCVAVPLHAAARPETLQPVLTDAEPHWVVAGGELTAMHAAILAANPGIRALVAWNAEQLSESKADARHVAWRLSFDDGEALTPGTPRSRVASELAALIYTSGTTGEPKGAMLSHDNMVAALRAVNAYLHVESSDVIYSALPLSSSYGIYQLLLGLAVGATTVLDRSFAFPARSLFLLAQERATVFAGVPTMYAWMATTTALGQFDLSSLRVLTSAAAALPVEHIRLLRERLPGVRIYVMYGQTECKRITYLAPDDLDIKPGSVGRGMPYQQHAVIDASGVPVPPGATGELVVRGPHVMQGYWRNPEATAHKLRPIAGRHEPWLHTDDLFRIDEDGYLYFVGRRDDILKVGGHKVSPREIEEVLCQMPDVREAAVIGMPDPVWGQAAKAYVVLRDGASCGAEDVVRFCKARLRAFMVPKTVMFARELPKTESGKIKKRELP